MAWNETKLTVAGTVCTNIGTRATSDGNAMAFFTIASNERRFNKDTDTWENGNSLYVRIKCFRRLAEHVASTLIPGDRVLATGRVYTTKYQVDGQSRQDLEMEAVAIGPDLTFCSATIDRTTAVSAVAA